MTQTPQTSRPSVDVAPFGYGAMSIGGAYGPIDAEASIALLHAIADRGVTFIDTANIYGHGVSESLVGRFLTERGRDEFTIATKTGLTGGVTGLRTIRGDRDYIHEQVDTSLRRLGVETIDLYYQHRVDPGIPIEDTVGAFAELIEAGKIRSIGLSEATGDELRRADAVHPITAIQSEWSIFSRDVEQHVVPAAAELGVTFVSYSTLSRGLLTDSFDASAPFAFDGDVRRSFPRFDAENLPANAELASEVRAVAARLGVSTEEIALAWVRAKGRELGASVSLIPGTRSVDHLEANLRALELELGPDDVAELDTIAARVQGARTRTPAWVSGGREGLI